MADTLTLLLFVMLAQGQSQQIHGHSPTKITHRTDAHGCSVHEAETDGVTDGLIVCPNGKQQEIHNGKPGKVFPTTWPKDIVELANDELPSLPPGTPSLPPVGSDIGATIIDDYVYVSPEQVAAWGGMTGTINRVTLAADAMNESFTHAGVNAFQRVVDIAQYDINESGNWTTDFNAFTNRYAQGGFNALRTTTGFDELSLIVKNTFYCGQAYVFASGFPLKMVNGDCSAANVSFAHEAGHTMGLCHNFGDSSCTPAAICGPTAVGYGSSTFRTPMSYTGGPRTRQYSAPPPAIWYGDGHSAVGTTNTNAVGCLVKTVPIVAGWHATVVGPIGHTTPTNLTWTPPVHTTPTALTWTAN